jgi:hypothetical protein
MEVRVSVALGISIFGVLDGIKVGVSDVTIVGIFVLLSVYNFEGFPHNGPHPDNT